MTAGRRRRIDQIPEKKAAIVGVNIRTLRQRKGWTQAELGELMGWPNASTVCAAEGHRNGRQRGFTTREIERLAAIFDISPRQLTTRCANCNGQPPGGFACLACGAALNGHHCRIEPFLDRGGACGAASGAPRAGLWPLRGPARRARAVPDKAAAADKTGLSDLRAGCAHSRLLHPVMVQRPTAASRAPYGRCHAIGYRRSLDPAVGRSDPAPTRKPVK